MKSLAIGTLKGGVGKTITTFSIAGILAEQGNKVLIIDADPQANITSDFRIDETQKGFVGLAEVLEEEINPAKVVKQGVIEASPSLDIIPSCVLLTGTEMRLVGLAGRELILKNYLKKNKDFFNQYDYIVFDTNPSMGIINQNVFVAVDSIVLVSDINMNSFKGTELFIALWDDIAERLGIDNKIKGFLINNFDNRIKLSKEFLEFCQNNETTKGIIFDNYIVSNVTLKESELNNRPINILDKESSGCKCYKNLIEEMRKRGIL